MFLPGAFQLRRERSSPVGMKPCWLVQVPAVSNRPAQEALGAPAAGTNSYGVAGSAWLHTFSRRTAGSGGPAPLSFGDVPPRRNVGPDGQKPSIGTGQSMSLDRGNGRRGAHRTRVECRVLYVLAT